MAIVENIFLLNPPFSGSTVMAKVLLTSPVTWSPSRNAEGQRVEEVTEEMRRDRWNPEVDFDWARIRAAWLKLKPDDKTVMIEKSPPNLLRVSSIMKTFANSVFVVSNRDPYAWLGGVINHKIYRCQVSKPRRRAEVIQQEISRWVFRSKVLIKDVELVRGRCLVTRYLDFCSAPEIFLQNLYSFCGDLKADPHVPVRVKSYPVQGVVNMNPRQIARLTPSDVALANSVLVDASATLNFFGYKLLDPAARATGRLARLSRGLRRIRGSRADH